jgi:hypothetical protein
MDHAHGSHCAAGAAAYIDVRLYEAERCACFGNVQAAAISAVRSIRGIAFLFSLRAQHS